ncbi:Oligopeptide ABC transporter, periplasmic oligopeptide-binding protein OppA (TC 3.A.1.5.1) [hydrothermal vent metagenome]|uniref:Oligopeptide ABC transporter, periplasmic oligopeptide-binding protein OppA (TC 3.A.1.5.1) n=1 Tax=hydrothermal vent metagenome TaxID=652676 RepID=A0A3B1CZV7_9ZZZZ
MTQPSVNKYGGHLVLATTSDPKSFNAITAKESSTSLVTGYIFEGLTTTNAFTAKVEPHLAKRWEVSADGLQWTFFLRKDVTWHDGHPFTADDVVFTFNDLIYNKDIPSSARDIYTIDGKIFKVEKINTYVVRFTLPVKFAPFLRGLGQEILPKHKLESIVKEGKFNTVWGIDTLPSEIVGTGAYRLAQYDPGQRLIFKKNPSYWKKASNEDFLPYMDKIIYLIVQNQDVALLKFMEGTLDAYGLRGMDYPLLKPLEKKRNFVVHDLGPDTGSQFIFFNQNPEVNPNTNKPFVEGHKLAWFRNVVFRRAIAHVIDKDKIIEIVKNKLGYPQHSSMGPGAGFFHNPNVAKYDYDLDKAKNILNKAGFKDRDGNGILEDTDGNELEFSLYTNSGASERLDIAAIISHDLEKIGMKVHFRNLEFNTLVGKLTSTFEWEAVILGLTGGIEPHFGKNVWMSSGQLHMWYPRQEKPSTDWEKRIDEIFDQGVQELDENKRKVLYDEHQEIVARQLPLIYTVLGSKLTAVRNKFGNLKPSNLGGIFHNIEEIYIKP